MSREDKEPMHSPRNLQMEFTERRDGSHDIVLKKSGKEVARRRVTSGNRSPFYWDIYHAFVLLASEHETRADDREEAEFSVQLKLSHNSKVTVTSLHDETGILVDQDFIPNKEST